MKRYAVALANTAPAIVLYEEYESLALRPAPIFPRPHHWPYNATGAENGTS